MRTIRVDPLTNGQYVSEYLTQFRGYFTESEFKTCIDALNKPFRAYKKKMVTVWSIILFSFISCYIILGISTRATEGLDFFLWFCLIFAGWLLVPIPLIFFNLKWTRQREHERAKIIDSFDVSDRPRGISWIYTKEIYSFAARRQSNLVIELPEGSTRYDFKC
ncbi:92_t:CDS:2 [Paraglomus brasilianum]|uniref:92_t:CDS:1 n=1 Tax=Paraglomus brasilianum TaxID=144538 RepID=A0A9N8WTE5_9GLOM|nr:92_t:CDS:2 [Paraglomus brasilianum]